MAIIRSAGLEKTKPNKPNFMKGKSDKAKDKRNQEFLCSCVLFAKQSQFLKGQIDTTSYLKGGYGNNRPAGGEKNKPKQSQF